MKRPRSLAAAQTVPVRGDVDGNVAQHLALARTAAEAGAEVLVFPELSLIGYELELARALAFSEDDPRLAPLALSASSHSMILVAGAPVRCGPKLHIGAFVIFPGGTIELYTKHHLGAFAPSDNPGGPIPPAEDTVFQPGDRNPLVELGGNTGALAVCADWTHPSHPRAAAARGANTYLTGMFTIPLHLEAATAGLGTYAKLHAMAVVYANYGGPTGGLVAAGRSAIWSDTGQLLGRLEERGVGVIVAKESEAGWSAKTVMVGGA